MPRITEHKNAHLSTENMHEVKGFPSASVGSSTRKSMNGGSEFLRDSRLPNAITSTLGYKNPLTEVDGDTYVITSPDLDVNGIVWSGGSVVRITFSAGYNNIYVVGNYLQMSGAPNSKHNGVFLIDDTSGAYLDVIITAVTDGTDDVASGSEATAYVTHQDYDPESLSNGQSIPRVGQVRYYENIDLWYGDSFLSGDCYYNEALGSMICYNGSVFTSPIQKTSITKTANYTVLAKDQRIYVDSSSAAFTITLELNPTLDRELEIIDSIGSCGSNTVTVNGNGKNIIGNATAMMNANYIAFILVYNGTQWNLK